MSRLLRWLSVLMVVATGTLSIGCTTDELDAAHLESTLAARLEAQLGQAPVLDCSGVEHGLGAGDEFGCHFELGRATVPVLVRFGESREVASATVQARLMESASIAELVGARLSDELGPTKIECGVPVVAAAVDGLISDCSAIDESGISRALELIVDESGSIEVSLAP